MPIARPPTTLDKFIDVGFRGLAHACAWLTVILVLYIVVEIGHLALPAMQERGVGFLTGTTWDNNKDVFGILPEIWGTVYSSMLALLLGGLFGVSAAVFLSEGFLSGFVFWTLKKFNVENRPFWSQLPEMFDGLLKSLIELLAAIPSVVYGLWGLFVVIPTIRGPANWLHEHMGWFPLFDTSLSGPGMLPAALVLAIMILPTVTAISRDALVAVPPKLREAAYGLGATRWEAIFKVILPTAAGGIFGSIILGFGRALGETMALAMLVGNANVIEVSLFSPANTLAARLANSFREATAEEVSMLMYAALVLLAITLLVNIAGAWIVQRATAGLKEIR